MKHKLHINFVAIVLLLLTSIAGIAQTQKVNTLKIGTGTQNSDALVDLESTDKGLLIPRVALSSTLSVSPLSAHVAGMVVYNTATTGDVTPGFYINNGSGWTKTADNAIADHTEDAWENDNSNTRIQLSTQSDGTTTRSAGTEFVVLDNGFTGFGTTNPLGKQHLYGSTFANSNIIFENTANSNTDTFAIGQRAATGGISYFEIGMNNYNSGGLTPQSYLLIDEAGNTILGATNTTEAANPADKLYVYGNITSNNAADGTNAFAILNISSGTSDIASGFLSAYQGGYTTFPIFTNKILLGANSSASNGLLLQAATTGQEIGFNVRGTAASGNDEIEMTLTNEGDLGIGTTTPQDEFEVRGDKVGTNTAWFINDSDNAASGGGIGVQSGDGTGDHSNGYLRAFHGGYTGSGSFADRIVLGANSAASNGILLHAGAVGQNIEFNADDTNGIVDMILDTNGNLGIGTTAPTALLSVNGAANKPGGGAWTVFSDVRSKENILNYNKGLNELVQLRPVSYTYKKEFGFGTETQVGLIAQEVEQVVPSMVSEIEVQHLDDFKQVDPNELTYMLINAVKELEAKIVALEKENTTLKSNLAEANAIKERLNDIEIALGIQTEE